MKPTVALPRSDSPACWNNNSLQQLSPRAQSPSVPSPADSGISIGSLHSPGSQASDSGASPQSENHKQSTFLVPQLPKKLLNHPLETCEICNINCKCKENQVEIPFEFTNQRSKKVADPRRRYARNLMNVMKNTDSIYSKKKTEPITLKLNRMARMNLRRHLLKKRLQQTSKAKTIQLNDPSYLAFYFENEYYSRDNRDESQQSSSSS
jgi:hypothetical protein